MAMGKLMIFLLQLSWTVHLVTAIQRKYIFPYGTLSGDLTLQEGDDETSKVLALKRPLYFYESQFNELYVATNGIISAQDLPMEKQYVDDGFPTDFPVIAPFLADIDTSQGNGAIYYRVTESPTLLNRVAQEVHRGFPGGHFTPTHAVIATWENVAAYEEVTRATGPSDRLNTFQAVVAYDENDSYALFLYPEDGLHFFGTRPKESYNVEIELPARVGFSRGEVSFIFSRMEGPYYSVTSNEQSLKNLYQVGNTGVPGVWLFHIGNRYSFENVVPASVGGALATPPPRGQEGDDSTTAEYPETFEEEPDEDYPPIADPDFLSPTIPEFLQPSHLDHDYRENDNHGKPPPASGPSAPQVFPRPEHTVLEVFPNNRGESSPHMESDPPLAPHGGHFVSVVEEEDVDFDTGVIQYSTETKETCARFQQQCSQNADCTDYSSGFCCHCRSGFYGNGRHCLPDGAPHRVNGKVSGTVIVGSTPVDLNSVDLHAYIVVSDGRAYTAISEVPEPVGWALMPVAPIGELFGWLFALELPNSQAGFKITGAEFTRHAEVTFYPGNQRLSIVQTAQGLDSENHLSVDTRLHGDVPFIAPGATVQMEPYKETYQYYPSVVRSTSVREFTVVSAERGSETFTFQLHQNITYHDCRYGLRAGPETLQLTTERVFVMYVKDENILRYAITNKISPVGEPVQVNPCYSGTHDCDTTAQCLPGEGQQYQCQCATGYMGDGRNCYDVDECVEGLSLCGAHAQCVNLPGSHRCQCQSGYKFGFDGRTCIDLDECRSQPCHPQATCSNTLGSFQCQCQYDFQGDGFQCTSKQTRLAFVPHCLKILKCALGLVVSGTVFQQALRHPERPKTQCEQHRDSLQGGLSPRGPRPVPGGLAPGAFVPQCDEQGQYRALQCHGSTGHCWCVDSRGQERAGTRTLPRTPPTNCDRPGETCSDTCGCDHSSDGGFHPQKNCVSVCAFVSEHLLPVSTDHTERPKTQCEHHRDSVQTTSPEGYSIVEGFLPQCDEQGQYRALQCHSSTGHCWCVDNMGQERAGTRKPPGTGQPNCDEPDLPERAKTHCEQHKDSVQTISPEGYPIPGVFVPECDEQGQYRALQCHGSTGHCWCVDSRGQERAGTRKGPGTSQPNCDEPGRNPVVPPTQRPETVCERWRASLVDHYGGLPGPNHYLPQCDPQGQFNPIQCYGDSSYCWCVDRDGREVAGTRSHDVVKPACVPTVAPPTMHPLPRPDVTPPPSGTSLLYAQGQQIGALPLNGTLMDSERSSTLLALHGSIVVGIDYDCREKKVYWTDLAGRTINRARLEPGAEPETLINTGLTSPEGLAVDVVRRAMFWVDSTPDKIERANLDGSGRQTLFDTDMVNPRAIIVDSSTGTLYWTDWNREAPKIERSSVDGHSRKVLVKDGIGLPNALTFDTATRQVCWADAGTKRLECIASDGTGRRVIHSNLNYPFSMVFYANHFYFTDWRRDGVIALSRDSSQFTDEYLPDQRSHLYGVTIATTHCL
uniref:Nidogen 2 n=1 Tax=Oncorhynchus kisutch TaxID=8019 RepID=A0A8C7FJA6_ONCKI